MTIAVPFSCHSAGLPRVDEAIALLRARFAPVPQTEALPLRRAAGRILAADAVARVCVPPCDRSAMDGYAFRHGGENHLRLVGRALPGAPFTAKVAPGECVAVATGAALPDGCDTVAMREHCLQLSTGIVVKAAPAAHVRRRAEDFAAGDRIVRAGTALTARHLGLLSSAGIGHVDVRRKLRVAVLSIGNELNVPDGICDANRVMLMAACEGMGMEVGDAGILPDCRDTLTAALARAAATHDVVISSAGTSMGDEDHARGAILDCGGDMLLAGVAVKPGKPIAFGRIGHSLLMALPGNPAAAFITFAVMGAPLLRHLGGATIVAPAWQTVPSGFSHAGKNGLREYLRVRLHGKADGATVAVKAGKDGAAMLSSLAASDGLVCHGEDDPGIEPGAPLSYCGFSELLAP